MATALSVSALGCGSVSAPPMPDAAVEKLQAITITGKASLAWPLTTKLVATAMFTSGKTLDISNVATWSSSATAAATVDSDGNVVAVDAGPTTITASYEGQMGTLALTIKMPLVVVSSFTGKSIDFFPANATGNVAPVRSIKGGTLTTLGSPRGLAVSGNELFVADQGGVAIDVFPIDGTGDIAPIRQIKGALTTISGPNHIAVSDTEIFVTDFSNHVTVFPKAATGNVAPSRTISPTGLSGGNGVAVDQGTLYIGDLNASQYITVPASSTGTVAPTTKVTGTAARVQSPNNVYIKNGEVFIGSSSNEIIVHPTSADGTVAPLRLVAGSQTTLGFTDGLAVLGNRVYAASGQSVIEFAAGASGNATPVATIAGALTTFNLPTGLVIVGAE